MSVPGDAEAGMISPGHEPANSQSGFVGGVQFVLVSATMPRGLEQTLGAYVPVSFLSFSSSFCSGVQMNCRFLCGLQNQTGQFPFLFFFFLLRCTNEL